MLSLRCHLLLLLGLLILTASTFFALAFGGCFLRCGFLLSHLLPRTTLDAQIDDLLLLSLLIGLKRRILAFHLVASFKVGLAIGVLLRLVCRIT